MSLLCQHARMRPFTLDPFVIDVPEHVVADLHQRLAATRWPEPETVDDWSQGVPLDYLRDVVEYWHHSYNWTERQQRLNTVDQFITRIDDIDIHFLHARSPHSEAMPLIITHGWPGSIVEFTDIIAPLVDPVAFGGSASDAFHVVCPSLPGYGFSGKPTTPGVGVERIARMWATLMNRLGYERWMAQGGDWGAAVTTQIGRDAPTGTGCAGIHVNMPIAPPTAAAMSTPTEADQAAFAAFEHYQKWDSGYSTQQRTRPQTLGYGLTDSPVGQLAWILEKFWAWTDCNGHPENAVDRDRILDNVMVYWVTASAASSARLYWESFGSFGAGDPVTIPTGVAAFPAEIIKAPRSWCENAYSIVHWTDMDAGGHFAAMEQPVALVDDIRAFARHIR